MKNNFPKALVVLELPDYKKHHSRLDLALVFLSVILLMLVTYGVLGDRLRALTVNKDTPFSYGTEVLSELTHRNSV